MNMNKFKLTKEEQEIEDHIEEYVPLSHKEQIRLNRALAKLRREKVIGISMETLIHTDKNCCGKYRID